ncbi:Flp pilus assembly complex ATPase component TadA [Pseudomonas syringae pv. syringae]|uniref:ATPase, T2SS/T4P/T4SS family n=1 Tax=Pseudomonas syringae TaxID=317 RepID=UPI00200AE852|nr:ATPase, T2SS/T4P/T4SS family [Pseudomonas syringae]MCK9759911.1 Flp pilus assembly complex ATPase component TadA [Pseudomonas syringae pv. syringae]MCK9774902.1 Flp pilus assembly complex ATPase component TadA [Pseudomonas syringae pv. syringae]
MSMPSITDVHLSTSGPDQTIIFPGQRAVEPENHQLVRQLIATIKQHPNSKKIFLEGNDAWRVQRMREGRYALRHLRSECPDLEKLGLPLWIKALLLSAKMRETGGLVVIFGLTGAGKTVTFSATIAARLRMLGGYALTAEDPPEDQLEGWHGKGFCEQIDVSEVGGLENAIPAALRCFPAMDSSMFGYGEVLNGDTAAQLLRFAGDGHLVFTTVHAKDIPTGMERLAAMAQAAGEKNANELLSSTLQLALHQRFNSEGKLIVSALPRENKIVSHIKRGEYAALTPEINQILLKNNGR